MQYQGKHAVTKWIQIKHIAATRAQPSCVDSGGSWDISKEDFGNNRSCKSRKLQNNRLERRKEAKLCLCTCMCRSCQQSSKILSNKCFVGNKSFINSIVDHDSHVFTYMHVCLFEIPCFTLRRKHTCIHSVNFVGDQFFSTPLSLSNFLSGLRWAFNILYVHAPTSHFYPSTNENNYGIFWL